LIKAVLLLLEDNFCIIPDLENSSGHFGDNRLRPIKSPPFIFNESLKLLSQGFW